MPNTPKFSGVFPAIVTPFLPSAAEVDFESLGNLVDYQLQAGIDGIVVCGSTGEAATLTEKEYFAVVSFVKQRLAGRAACIAGISVSSTNKAVELAKGVVEIGCNGLLVATPPYNKPSQAGLIEHFRAISKAQKLPIIAYNIPGRSGTSIATSTLVTLAKEGVICGVKESSGSMDTMIDVISELPSECGVFSGEDSLFLANLAHGGCGVISVFANAVPSEFVQVLRAWRENNIEEAKRVHMGAISRIRGNFIESNPVPVKYVLARKGIIKSPAVRLPLVELQPSSVTAVNAIYQFS